MTRAKNAIDTLLRWRTFEEARAQAELLVRRAQTHAAARERDGARERADAMRRERVAMDTGLLDPARMQHAGAIEARAWDAVETQDAVVAEAREHEADGLALHLQARTRTQVAATREARIAQARRDEREKRAFDQVADLVSASRRKR